MINKKPDIGTHYYWNPCEEDGSYFDDITIDYLSKDDLPPEVFEFMKKDNITKINLDSSKATLENSSGTYSLTSLDLLHSNAFYDSISQDLFLKLETMTTREYNKLLLEDEDSNLAEETCEKCGDYMEKEELFHRFCTGYRGDILTCSNYKCKESRKQKNNTYDFQVMSKEEIKSEILKELSNGKYMVTYIDETKNKCSFCKSKMWTPYRAIAKDKVNNWNNLEIHACLNCGDSYCSAMSSENFKDALSTLFTDMD